MSKWGVHIIFLICIVQFIFWNVWNYSIYGNVVIYKVSLILGILDFISVTVFVLGTLISAMVIIAKGRMGE